RTRMPYWSSTTRTFLSCSDIYTPPLKRRRSNSSDRPLPGAAACAVPYPGETGRFPSGRKSARKRKSGRTSLLSVYFEFAQGFPAWEKYEFFVNKKRPAVIRGANGPKAGLPKKGSPLLRKAPIGAGPRRPFFASSYALIGFWTSSERCLRAAAMK